MTFDKTMKAVVLTGHGDLDKLEYRDDYPVPMPGEYDVLIRVGACGMNNTDVNEQRMKRLMKTIPAGVVRRLNFRVFKVRISVGKLLRQDPALMTSTLASVSLQIVGYVIGRVRWTEAEPGILVPSVTVALLNTH